MCPCNGTGMILTELFAGVVNFIPCTCEVSEIQRKAAQKRYAEFEKNLDAAEKEWERVHGR